MKVITLNLNGIRAAHRKGLLPWIYRQKADVICFQETRSQVHQLDGELVKPRGYHAYFNDAEKKGYSGTAIYARRQPDRVHDRLGWGSADTEGRYLQADFGNVSVISLYMPSGTSGDERQEVKYDFMDRFMPLLKKFRRQRRHYIICGDWNIAHKAIDLKNWRSNRKNSGFLPEERAWMDQLFDEVGLVDAFRVVNQKEDQYTWWSNRGRAWDKNVGWRIDYQVISPSLKKRVSRAHIYRDGRFSDHAPLTIEYDLDLPV
mgnify:FL=1